MVNSLDDTNTTPLHVACSHEPGRHAAPLLQLLLHHSASVNATDEFLETPLHKASYAGCVACAKLLVQGGASLTQVSSIHETALHSACRGRNHKVAKYLLKKGVPVDERSVFWRTALSHACEEGDLSTAKLLVRRGARINTLDADKQSPLLLACTNQHVSVVEMLLRRGAALPHTILHRYCADRAVSALLFRFGANINGVDHDGHNILHNASREGNAELVRTLLDHISWASLPFGRRLRGVISGHTRRNAGLFEEPDISVNMTDRQKCTPLHLACERGHLEVARLLVRANANVRATDRFWRSPLHLACEAGHTGTALLLLERGANALRIDKNGKSPLHLACSLSPALHSKTLDLQLVAALIAAGGYLYLNRACDRTLLKDVLKTKWPVNRKILHTLLNEKAVWPLPKPGQFVKVPLCKEDLDLHNILNVVNVDPIKLLMLYKFGYDVPGVYSQVMYVHINHPHRFAHDPKWDVLMKEVGGITERAWPLRELCRFVIRHHLGRNVAKKLEHLTLPNPHTTLSADGTPRSAAVITRTGAAAPTLVRSITWAGIPSPGSLIPVGEQPGGSSSALPSPGSATTSATPTPDPFSPASPSPNTLSPTDITALATPTNNTKTRFQFTTKPAANPTKQRLTANSVSDGDAYVLTKKSGASTPWIMRRTIAARSPASPCRTSIGFRSGLRLPRRRTTEKSKPTAPAAPNHRALPKSLQAYLLFSELLTEEDLQADRVFLRNKSIRLHINR